MSCCSDEGSLQFWNRNAQFQVVSLLTIIQIRVCIQVTCSRWCPLMWYNMVVSSHVERVTYYPVGWDSHLDPKNFILSLRWERKQNCMKLNILAWFINSAELTYSDKCRRQKIKDSMRAVGSWPDYCSHLSWFQSWWGQWIRWDFVLWIALYPEDAGHETRQKMHLPWK